MARHTLRGQIVEGEIKRLIVDDGQLNMGHKVVRFVVVGDPSSTSNDAYAVLSKEYDAPSAWNWGDGRQIAWSGTVMDGTGGVSPYFELVDRDQIIIQDLYIQGTVGSAGGTSVINYYIELEPVTLTDDQAVLQLIKERSQDDIR